MDAGRRTRISAQGSVLPNCTTSICFIIIIVAIPFAAVFWGLPQQTLGSGDPKIAGCGSLPCDLGVWCSDTTPLVLESDKGLGNMESVGKRERGMMDKSEIEG